jgi:hypothetical protein
MNPNQINLATMAKHFCQGVMIAYSNDVFFVIVDSGDAKTTYVFTPEHMKQLYQSIGYNLGEFEKKSRKIEANWSSGIQSPIQSPDLKDPSDQGNQGKKK